MVLVIFFVISLMGCIGNQPYSSKCQVQIQIKITFKVVIYGTTKLGSGFLFKNYIYISYEHTND